MRKNILSSLRKRCEKMHPRISDIANASIVDFRLATKKPASHIVAMSTTTLRLTQWAEKHIVDCVPLNSRAWSLPSYQICASSDQEKSLNVTCVPIGRRTIHASIAATFTDQLCAIFALRVSRRSGMKGNYEAQRWFRVEMRIQQPHAFMRHTLGVHLKALSVKSTVCVLPLSAGVIYDKAEIQLA